MLNWLDVAFSLTDPLKFTEFVKVCKEKGVVQKLTEIDYHGRVSGTKAVMRRDNHTDHQLAYENIFTLHRGVGDIVATVAHAFGIKPCGGCQKRRETANRFLPFRVKENE